MHLVACIIRLKSVLLQACQTLTGRCFSGQSMYLRGVRTYVHIDLLAACL